MARRKQWYDPEASEAIRVVPRAEDEPTLSSLRWRHARVRPGLGECLLYPLSDGPGLGLLVLFPPAMWVLSLPVFDFIAMLQPLTKGNWKLGLIVLPIFIPLLFSFSMTFGYVLLSSVMCLSPARSSRTIILAGPNGIPQRSPRVSSAGFRH